MIRFDLKGMDPPRPGLPYSALGNVRCEGWEWAASAESTIHMLIRWFSGGCTYAWFISDEVMEFKAHLIDSLGCAIFPVLVL